MRLSTYKNISLIASRIRQEILCHYSPGDKIPSERKIASILKVSHNRVHRALQQLVEDCVIYSTGGRRGMFYTSALSDSSGKARKSVKLKFAMAISETSLQYRSWKRVCELFHMIEPSVEIQIVCNTVDVDADIYLTWLPLYDCSRYRELDLSRIEAVKDMVPGIISSGVQYGKQFGLPILHSPAVYWGHRNMLSKCGLKVEDFKDPMDYFRWGKILEDSRLCTFGNSFLGFIYHSCHWGVSYHREGDVFLMDPVQVRNYFEEIKEISREYFHLENVLQGFQLFHRGQQGLFPGYLNLIPLTERKFQLLGQPLRNGGYSCQVAFMLAMGKYTEYEDIIYDFFRFLLSEHIQELFLRPEIKFSVIDSVYREQHQIISDETGVSIPEFDPRGLMSLTDPDITAFIGRILYNETSEIVLGYKKMEKIIDTIIQAIRLFLYSRIIILKYIEQI